MASQTERHLVRILIGVALCVAIFAASTAPSALPAVALGQSWLYRLEVALLAFYGCLLLITPAFSGLIRGRLPIEISTRGAKFAEETDQSAKLTEAKINALKGTVDALAEGLTTARAEIEQVRESLGDNEQRKVGSE